jgi:curved DNA-binding protein
MEYKDYYKTLGVGKTATADEIKKSYRKLARKYHPDTNKDKDAENKFKDISEAYEVLGDVEKRQKYDQLGNSYSRFKTTGGNPTDFNWNDWFAQNYNSNANPNTSQRSSGFNSQGTGNRNTVGDFFNSGGGVSDFFERIFGSTSTKGKSFNSQKAKPKATTQKVSKGKNYQKELVLTLHEVFYGAKRVLNVNGEHIEVKFKAGIADGHTQKISGKGYPSNDGDGKSGDLIIKVKISEDNKIERKNNDLYTSVECGLYVAILGGEIICDTFFDSFKIKVSPETPNGKLFKLTGQGMPIYNSTKRGDLYIKLSIILPSNLSEEEKELFNQLKKIR